MRIPESTILCEHRKSPLSGYHQDATKVYFVQLEDEGQTNVLVNGKRFRLRLWIMLNWLATLLLLRRTARSFLLCSDCGQTAAIYKTKDAAKAPA